MNLCLINGHFKFSCSNSLISKWELLPLSSSLHLIATDDINYSSVISAIVFSCTLLAAMRGFRDAFEIEALKDHGVICEPGSWFFSSICLSLTSLNFLNSMKCRTETPRNLGRSTIGIPVCVKQLLLDASGRFMSAMSKKLLMTNMSLGDSNYYDHRSHDGFEWCHCLPKNFKREKRGQRLQLHCFSTLRRVPAFIFNSKKIGINYVKK